MGTLMYWGEADVRGTLMGTLSDSDIRVAFIGALM